MVTNRREYSRFPLSAKVTVTMNDVILSGTECRNISKGGMCIAVDDRIDRCDDGLLIMVYKCDDEVVFFTSEFSVLWNNVLSPDNHNAQIGVVFKDINPTNNETLSRIISFQSSQAN